MTLRRSALAALAALALAACGGDSSTGPTPTATLSLANAANVPITAVYFSACDDTEWGANRLGAGESIATGGSRTWSIPAGCYDVKASTGTKAGQWYDRQVTAGETLELELSPAANSLVAGARLGAAKAR